MIVVALDPGRDAGVALFVGGHLVGARLLDGRAPAEGLTDLGLLVGDAEVLVELPVLYTGGRSRAPGGDLITLAYRAGRLVQAVVGALGPRTVRVSEIQPQAWKAQVAPEILAPRICAHLKPDEEALVREAVGLAKSKTHNVLDAAGIGLWRVGRMGRGGT